MDFWPLERVAMRHPDEEEQQGRRARFCSASLYHILPMDSKPSVLSSFNALLLRIMPVLLGMFPLKLWIANCETILKCWYNFSLPQVNSNNLIQNIWWDRYEREAYMDLRLLERVATLVSQCTTEMQRRVRFCSASVCHTPNIAFWTPSLITFQCPHFTGSSKINGAKFSDGCSVGPIGCAWAGHFAWQKWGGNFKQGEKNAVLWILTRRGVGVQNP